MKTMTIGFILIITCAIEYGYGQNKLCGLDKFQCKNGHCIASELLCDGRADCKDESDETLAECSKPGITCPGYAFRCAYGACVDGDATCNGVKDCIDNSDETLSRCTGSQYNASTTCSTNEFKCSNGECISASSLCDGTPDCGDKSDETFIQCGSIACSQLFFRCHYGACIDGNLRCNGAINCADGSDENPELCGSVTEKSPETDTSPWIPSPTTSPTREFCSAPPQPQNGYRKLHKSQCSIAENCDIEEGTELQPGAYLVYTCTKGYKIKGSADVVCGVGGKWLNIPVCEEIRCKSLLSTSVTAQCKYDDQEVSCDSALPRTRAEMSCRNSYRPDITSPLHLPVRCNENGQWEPEPMRCIPECGVTSPDATPLIVNGTRPNITEFPWHATIYRAEAPDAIKEFICGATIINERLLVTAAHCVFIESTKRLDDPSKYYILTGNIYKDYDSILHNPLTVKKAKVKNIYIVCNYLGYEGNYAGDIAILEITKPFVFSSLLVPICLDIYHQVELEVGILGKVAGFGKTKFGTYSSVLQSITVPYIPLNQCISSSVPFETKRYITIDKFCAGYTNGSSVCDGDSGGGLVFQSGNLWYLKGIVSVSLGVTATGAGRTCDSTTYSLYTKVSRHMTWIQDVILRLQINKSFPSCFTLP